MSSIKHICELNEAQSLQAYDLQFQGTHHFSWFKSGNIDHRCDNSKIQLELKTVTGSVNLLKGRTAFINQMMFAKPQADNAGLALTLNSDGLGGAG